MTGIRFLLSRHRTLAGLLVAATLLLRIIVPAGFMPMADRGRIVVAICTGTGPATMTIDLPGANPADRAVQGDGSCAFADLALPVLGGAGPVLLAAAIAFLLLLGLAPSTALPPGAPRYLRPPLRGPPRTA